MERDMRSINARRQELLQSGLTLGPTNSTPPVSVKREDRSSEGFTLGNSSLKSRLSDVNHGGYGDKGDIGLKVNAAVRGEMESIPALESGVRTTPGLHFDTRGDAVRSTPTVTPMLGDSKSLALPQSLLHFRQGTQVQQRLSNSNGSMLTFSTNSNITDGSPRGMTTKEASPTSSPGQMRKPMPPGNAGQQNLKPTTAPRQTPPQEGEISKGQGVVLVQGSPQHQALQQQALHQQTLHQAALHQRPPQQQAAFQAGHFKGGPSPPQLSQTQHMGLSQLHPQRNVPPQSQAMKLEPMEIERMPPSGRMCPFNWASPDQASILDQGSLLDPASPLERGLPHKETVEAADRDQGKGPNQEASKVSVSPGESRDSGSRLGRGLQEGGGREGGGGYSTGHSGGRSSREGVFADLNAEPPPSDGEEDGVPASDGLPPIAQPESSRTTPDDKKKRKKVVKEPKCVKEGDEETKKAGKPTKSRSKPKGELVTDAGLDIDSDAHLVGLPTTREEKIKSLKEGLIHVSRKLPKNAHAHFALGLMYQRLGQPLKAATAFEKAIEILKQAEEETGHSRTRLLALVQNHRTQCLLQGSIGVQVGIGKEFQKEEVDSVVSKLQEMTHTAGGQASIWNTLGLLLLRTGRIQSAIAVLTSLLEVVPKYLDALANLGVAYLHSGELARAARCLQAVLEKDRNHPGTLVNYGALLVRQYGSSFAGVGAGGGRDAYATQLAAAAVAQRCLEAALKEDASAGHVWANLAAAFSVSGNLGNASCCLEQATKLEPSRMSTRYAVASHRVRDAEQSEHPVEQLSWAANEMASILREGDPATVQPRLAWAGLAMVNRAQHESATSFEGGGADLKEVEDRAVHTLQQAIMEDPEDAVQWQQLGLHTLCTLQFGLAQSYLKTAIARRNKFPVAWSNLGIAVQLSEDPSLAEGVYKQALGLVPPEQAHSVYCNLGNLYRQMQRFSEAHSAYQKALELCPDYAPASNNLGLLLIAEGRWDDAIGTFDRALLADPYLDAAQSNRMKAVALAQIRNGGIPPSKPPAGSPVVEPQAQTKASQPSPSPSDKMAPAAAASSPFSIQGAVPQQPPQEEPFPLPSIS